MLVCRASLLAATAAIFITGCSHSAGNYHPIPLIPEVVNRSLLAGEWEYEDGGAVVLRLDDQGNGTYAFKEGRFETRQFDGQIWGGKWYQRENDRDGGFLVTLSPDHTEGDGTWWYDRIGPNTSPSEKGGTFHVSRRTSVTRLNETPSPP